MIIRRKRYKTSFVDWWKRRACQRFNMKAFFYSTLSNRTNKTLAFSTVSLTFFILCSSGSSHMTLLSQWLSKNVNTSPVARSAPLTRDLINPSRWVLRISLTFGSAKSSSPSKTEYEMGQSKIWGRQPLKNLKEHGLL